MRGSAWIDDIGMLPVGEDAAEGFYRLVDACYEKEIVATGGGDLLTADGEFFMAVDIRLRLSAWCATVPWPVPDLGR
jgi:hypothetical protein